MTHQILAVDCGNTQIKLGVFQDEALVANFRLATDPQKTSDEYAVLIRSLLAGDHLAPSRFSGSILASVVPPVQPLLEWALEKVLGRPCQSVTPLTKTGLRLEVVNPAEVGADLICLAVGAVRGFPLPAIIVSFGTATAFLAVNREPALVGAAIAPGILTAARSLSSSAAKLPQIDLAPPRSALGRDTIEAMRAGLIFGFAGLVERIVSEMAREMGDHPHVIATGGLLNLISQTTKVFDHYEPFLSLQGLRHLWSGPA